MNIQIRQLEAFWREHHMLWRALVWLVCAAVVAATANPTAASGWTRVYVGPELRAVGAPVSDLTAEPTPLGPERPPSVKEVLMGVCEMRGYGDECAKFLLGMAWKESLFDADAVGDNGLAHGFFQIHTGRHRVSLECAEDLQCSADWTISYMESNGYPRYPRYAVQCHNGCNVANGYAASVTRHGERLWRELPPETTTTNGLAVATRE